MKPSVSSFSRIVQDEALVRKCFLDYLREKVVQLAMQSMSDVVALLQCDPSNIPATFEIMFSHNTGDCIARDFHRQIDDCSNPLALLSAITKQTISTILGLRGDLDKHQVGNAYCIFDFFSRDALLLTSSKLTDASWNRVVSSHYR